MTTKTKIKERGILFSAPMVKAILDGRKTQTRRVVKQQPDYVRDGVAYVQKYADAGVATRCPYGQPGDRLWVREAFCAFDIGRVHYRADFAPGDDESVWKSPIFMPRWASRLTLEITDVRVERVQSISEADALAEGITSRPNCVGFRKQDVGWSGDWSQVGKMSLWAETSGDDGNRVKAPLTENDIALGSPRHAFGAIWDSINAKTHPWASNPWVWVITFKREVANG